jgi:ATP-binding cassette subfamily B (MDR/TAP) protein 1
VTCVVVLQTLYEDASQVATDAVSSIRTVASFCAEKRVTAIYDDKCEASKKQGVRTGMVGGLGFGFSFMMMYLIDGLCFYVGAQLVRHNKSTFDDVFKVRKIHWFPSEFHFFLLDI